ncbi:hypothetical protein [Cohnella thailandensis]|uniref:Uncharacterized protein n=2 Tax=Cohnella thailandensis TaxID=557557 RepID=A0A841T1F1_9BACL|nr:hypothetical protein [Cohnella thailandensis]MBB6636395.1 hypothetical protein [Cohnella thailandensis]MBP1973635.1 hypothetical protein [Cohnella thailandensis]
MNYDRNREAASMEEPVYLLIWLIGLFGLIGFVLAAVTNLVRKDTTEYDKRFTWEWKREWEEDGKN